MQHSFFQKLILVVIAGALTAGVFQFYKVFVVGGMEAPNGKRQSVEAAPTPRRF